MNGRPWTRHDNAQLRAAAPDWDRAAALTGHSPVACHRQWNRLPRRGPLPVPRASSRRRPRTPDDEHALATLLGLADTLGLTVEAVLAEAAAESRAGGDWRQWSADLLREQWGVG